MNFLSLEYFLTIVEERNFTTAAEKCYVSQQSLSEHIKKLEMEVGTPLIIRNRPLELTEAGEIFAEGAKHILDTKAQVLRDIAKHLVQKESKLVLAISTLEAPPLLPELIANFKEQYPDVEIEVVKRRKDTLAKHMEGISFYFDFAPLSEDLDHAYFIRNDCYVVICRQSLLQKTYPESWAERLSEIRKTGDLTLLKDLPFAVSKGQNGKTSHFIQTLFDSFQMTPIIKFFSDNGELNATLCSKGRSALVSSLFYECARYTGFLIEQGDPLLIIPLRTKRGSVPIALSYAKDKYFSTMESCFISATRKFLMERVEQFMNAVCGLDRLPPDLFY